jgi:hypothetical protein
MLAGERPGPGVELVEPDPERRVVALRRPQYGGVVRPRRGRACDAQQERAGDQQAASACHR